MLNLKKFGRVYKVPKIFSRSNLSSLGLWVSFVQKFEFKNNYENTGVIY